MSDRLQLVFIGTGASIPSARRRLPCLAIEREGEWVLCDCGEGTQFALAHNSVPPSKITHIFISHLHGDHLFGLPGLLSTLQMGGRAQPLTLWGPVGLTAFIRDLQKNVFLQLDFPLRIEEIKLDGCTQCSAGPYSISAAPLEHTVPCLGFRFQEPPKPGRFDTEKARELGIPPGPDRSILQSGSSLHLSDGRKIDPQQVLDPPRPGRIVVYCSDTRPCAGSRLLAQSCDVLVHDSTFLEDDRERARLTGHSTADEAAALARAANAKQLVLWHISGRYSEEQEKQMVLSAEKIFTPLHLSRDSDRLLIGRDNAT